MSVSRNGTAPSVIMRGIGSYAPERVMTNDELSTRVETSDEWIRTRTGIRERRIAADGEECSDMAAKAAERALESAGIDRSEIDLVVVASMTPDMPFPATACIVQDKLGLGKVTAFDIQAACSGFLYMLDIVTGMLRNGNYRNALIIGSERLSSIIDWEDRATCVLFGDGAGAAVLSVVDEPGVGVIDCKMGADGSQVKLLNMPGGGSSIRPTRESLLAREHFLKMEGKEVFKHAVRVMGSSAQDILARHGVTADDVTCIIPHQANIRIFEAISTRIQVPMDKFFMNLERYGNTSAASIPLAIDEAWRAGRFKGGDYVLLVAFGSGLTWGSSLIKWHLS